MHTQHVIPVYPRVCGGTVYSVVGSSMLAGLSPRVRGNPVQVATGTIQIGSIPACAGEPVNEGRPPVIVKVYPRVCGGTEPPYMGGECYNGLSPRVRGNPDHGAHR